MAVIDQVLDQLSDIQRTLGTVVGDAAALKEASITRSEKDEAFRETVLASVNNALTRIAALEQDTKALNLTMEKTIQPIVNERYNWKQRTIGFVSAWTIIATVGSAVFWFLSSGWGEIVKFFARMNAP